ncbi:MAG: exodeoxyribonuclease VII large subunit [Candidatus Desulfofervidus auxilii]|nr:exodeoxyribonuclease VII large subunit [Candidatus Desulfofervidus auxilii]
MEELSIFSVPQPHIYTVSELTEDIRQILEEEFPFIWVEGEVSNARRPLSGHLYFTLKDEKAQILCILFKNQRKLVKFEPQDGLKVICQGRITVYPPHGNYRLIVEYLEPKGYGALQLAFEQLKKKLAQEGLFDTEIKKALPFFPQRIAVVTSPVGAAIRDFLRVLIKKFPNVHVRIYPVRVQGEGAAQEIAQAIYDLNHLPCPSGRQAWAEIIVLTRGGGSLEDLWAFNEEVVARAIHASEIPVVSAVGHEVDFTIADMVADLRAPTPTAAAEMIIQKKEDLENFLQEATKRFHRGLEKLLETAKLHLNHLIKRLGTPRQELITHRLRLDDLSLALLRTIKHRIEREQTAVQNLGERLLLSHPKRQIQSYRDTFQQRKTELMVHFTHLHQKHSQHLQEIRQRLNALSPLNVLKRGYALAFTWPEGKLIKSINQVEVGKNMVVKVVNGEIKAKVEEKDESTI